MTGPLIASAADSFAEYWLPWLSLALGLTIVAMCARIYQRLLSRVLTGHGKVWTAPLGLPDLLATVVLITWLGGVTVHGFSRGDTATPLTDSAIIASATLFGIIVGALVLFLGARHIPVGRLFGLHNPRPWYLIKMAGSLLLAACPLVFLASAIVQWFAGEEPKPQEIVKYFTEATRNAEWGRVLLAGILGILVAPATEEFLFRGYFYGVLRRYLGIIPAIILTSALFASIHLSLPSFLPLFVLACCLTLAYETTGSLWTPMLMHAVFNAIMLGAMYYTAHHP